MGAEDFAVYLQKKPGLFAFLGCRNPDKKDTASPQHSDTFDIDEDVLPNGTAMYVQFALDYLSKEK